jgi:hypothetical protein
MKVAMNLFKTFTLTAIAVLLCGTAAQAAPVSGQGTWETTLQARDLDGDGETDAFYDTELNVTWLRNANANGLMNWSAAQAWADNLVVGVYSGWRLPFVVDTGEPGCDFRFDGGTDCGFNVQTKSGATVYSEFAHLYYTTLGNKAYCAPGVFDCDLTQPQPGWGPPNTGNFLALQADLYYWFGTEYAIRTGAVWAFAPLVGYQGFVFKSDTWYAIAVHPGDVTAAIPEPETYAFMLAGLTALVVVQRRRAKAALTH